MKFLIGLGNPGVQYDGTRHNIGFAAIDAAVARWLNHEAFVLIGAEKRKTFESWEFRSHGISCREPERVYCIKPMTFMNRSGEVVNEWLKYTSSEIKPESDLWVIHDEIDVPLGMCKIDQNKSSAGHNGVQSIIDAIGSSSFVRFRIGIKPEKAPKDPMADLVLKKFMPSERVVMEGSIQNVIEAIEFALAEGIARAQQKYHQKEKPSGHSLSA